ncbi:PREDICTED: RAS protein activator like-3 [Gekko japonicus]|uniref:RAS protein activator like-3 n=1 Tax=Gekko japonicus TaxID=146911 RepID=A0ABM1JHD0_GEKJA|nr:PREDICTED: RAS protein activator like-3 [Gekko japonicus]
MKMEASDTSRQGTDAPSVLSSYRWLRVPQDGEKEPEFAPSPASGHRGKPQRWRRVQSQTESERESPRGAPSPDSRAASKRSVFQRAFSSPAKMPKAQEGGGKLSLRKYLRSMSHWKKQEAAPQPDKETKEASTGGDSAAQLTPSALVTAPDAPLWDVANVSLLDRQLVLMGRDEESLLQSRKRTSSSLSETSTVYPVLYGQVNYEVPPDGAGGRRGFLDSQVPERRAPQEASSGLQLSSVKGLLRRRLRDRKERLPAKTDSSAAGLAANGHREALPGPELLVDLSNEKDVLIRPLHSSLLLGKKHCFEVLSAGGRRCFTCASATERTRWMEDLRRAVQPSKDNCERTEHMLSLWVYEARDLAPRRHCFCELRLDGALYARTTTKPTSPAGAVFWGEHFDLRSLPPAVQLQVCLVQEEEGQRHKGGSALASVALPLSDLTAARQPLEKWYPVGRGKPSVPALRLRGHHCSIRVPPIVQYKEFAEYLTFHYQELCAALEPSLSARDKEELAGALVRILQSTGKAKAFLIDLGIAELDRFDEREALIFRENTLATKAIDEYMKLVGGPYLLDTLSDVVADLYSLKRSCEVDPGKCALSELADNRSNLQRLCEAVFQRIDGSTHSFPVELNEVFTAWHEECQVRGKAGIGWRLISASLFLRFLCPAIMSPSLFGLTQEYPDDATSRTLILVAKVIQNLANFTTFGEKEAYMSFMNGFLECNSDAMTAFLGRVSSPGSTIPFADYGDSIDLALELSILHSLLCDIFSHLEERTQKRLEPLPTILCAIQKGTPVPVSVQLGPIAEDKRGAEHQKPGFVPPRELGKHNPLIKSHSMNNIQKVRGKEEPTAPSPRTRTSKVQRTQSVPTHSKAARHMRKQGSTEQVAKGREGGPWHGTSHPCGGSGSSSSQASRVITLGFPAKLPNPSSSSSPVDPQLLPAPQFPGQGAEGATWALKGADYSPTECPKGPLTGSLPRKPTVPWLRHSEEAAAAATRGGFYAVQPLEQYGRQVEEMRQELASAKEKQRRCEEQVERLAAQNQGLMEEQARSQERGEALCKRLEDAESGYAQLNSRLSAVESSWRKGREKLQRTEERARDLPPLSGPVWVNRTANGHEA